MSAKSYYVLSAVVLVIKVVFQALMQEDWFTFVDGIFLGVLIGLFSWIFKEK
ncbi:hypothetical protein GW781_10995 [bacterium]|nr:hypothetical protein [bacterium]NCT21671.1 hypothetical protein [bacterium]